MIPKAEPNNELRDELGRALNDVIDLIETRWLLRNTEFCPLAIRQTNVMKLAQARKAIDRWIAAVNVEAESKKA